MNAMTTTEIRAEIVEMISAGHLSVPKIKAYFKKYKPEANMNKVVEESKELVAEARMVMKRGY
jgi:hypothetical protein